MEKRNIKGQFKKGNISWSAKNKGKYNINKGKENPNWKGDKVGFGALHEWIRNHKPKSMFCEKCGKVTEKLDCANISGKYLRDISDFRWLCRRCHMKDDYKLGIRKGKGHDKISP